MPAEFDEYLAVLKASYDYAPQSDDEIEIKENQILFLKERVDDDWWKVKIKGDSQDDDSPVGLVPAAYVEPADHTSIVKAQYAYDAAANGELTIEEDELLYAFDAEDDWLLCQSQKPDGKAGYVPGNYVETVSEDDSTSASGSAALPAVTQTTTYVDPADRVASAKVKADDIKTWSVSEIDSKGKKKKGTLGVGNGAVFFASEADKTPVQQWKTVDVQSITIEKSKHVHISVGGPSSANLHFNAGSKDNAEAIVSKLNSSKEIHTPARPTSPLPTEHDPAHKEPGLARIASPARRSGASVHFSSASPAIIPPRDSSDDEDPGIAADPAHPVNADGEGDEDTAVALYDFVAGDDDELSVTEGERLAVLERDGDDWWKCRNTQGREGVVPASYLEATSTSAPHPHVPDSEDEAYAEAAREIEKRAEADRLESERHEKEERLRAEQIEHERAEKERERAEKERERKEERERVERERKKAEAQRRASVAPSADTSRKSRQEAPRAPSVSPPIERDRPNPRKSEAPSGSTSTKSSSDKQSRPPPDKTRVWHDKTGQFRVEAAFLGFNNGKLRLHKVNGVIVEVPAEKMSPDDLKYIERQTKRPKSNHHMSEDDIPLALQRPSGSSGGGSTSSSTRAPQQPPKKRVDWFDFFLSAGCDVDDCTRYASSFERDKIDEAILPDITESTMRSLGLREGDIIRVKKAIEKRLPTKQMPSGTSADQLARDEELAKRLQAEESGTVKPAPNLFASPGGALKAARRGRPQPTKSLPSTVDLHTITTVSDQIQRTSSPQTLSPVSTAVSSTVVQPPPPRTSSALATKSSGFDDDAWTNRPSSTRPIAPASPQNANPRAPSAPPTQSVSAVPLAPVPPVSTPSALPASASAAPASTTSPPLAKTTEDDIFNQLARLTELRKTQPAQSTPQAPPPVPSPAANLQLPGTNFVSSSSPNLMQQPQQASGYGPSPSPFQPQQQQLQPPTQINGSRGPFAPVPANQALLQPLIPTHTSFNNFVPTRPTNQSPFQNPSPSFVNSLTTGFPMQSNGMIAAQPTSFQPAPPNGFQAIVPQATSLPMGGFGQGSGLPTIQTNGFGQTSPTFNPGFGQLPIGNPSPQPASNPVNNTSPANVFAQMKSGTFAAENDGSHPQSANKYDALRLNPVSVQPTGWGYQSGYSGFQH